MHTQRLKSITLKSPSRSDRFLKNFGLCLALMGIGFVVRADEIKLRRGGVIHGTVQKTPDSNNGFYQILLDGGGLLKLAAKEVDSVVAPQASQADYQAEAAAHDLETVQGHLDLAEWCLEKKLRIQRSKHLRKVIQLEPNHESARRLLGYTRHLRTGKWVLRDEYYQSIGYVGSGTTMRLPAGLLVESEQKKHREALNQWKTQVPRLITFLKNPRKSEQARADLQAIDDLKAIEVLVDTYQKLGQRSVSTAFDRDLRSLVMNVIAKFDILSAKSFLLNVGLFERDDVLQDEALQILKAKHAVWATEYLVARLNRIPPVLKSLVNDATAIEHRDFISRAAIVLGQLETDASEAILPLINLVYINRVLVPLAPAKRGGLGGATFSKNGGVGMNQGSEKPVPRPVRIEIEAARIALVQLTEQRLGYNKTAWLDWYLSRTIPPRVDLRRLDDQGD
ncbi:MAG: hypothetical protein VX438_10165 [Planctomycetota bacterium]|nr:hypothetical protein [Planctomycetota bacterium]